MGEWTAAEQEAATRLFAGPCDFMLSVASLTQLPTSSLPEVAFVGRSNVGKSSILNALTRRKTLAKTSNTPGRTQHLNFFDLGGKLILVDLPGYGFAKVPKEQVMAWTDLLKRYLAGRPQLKRVCLLIDARHGVKASDREMMTMLDKTAVPYQIILTKADKISAAKQQACLEATQKVVTQHVAAHPEVLITSSVKRDGLAAVQVELAALATEG